MEIVDIKKVSKIAHKNGALVIVDNIFASPILQKPLKFGADIVVYSGTKHIDGQGRSIGGAILSSKNFYDNNLKPFIRHTGPTLSPINAWILLKSLETLNIRMEKHCDNATKVAKFLISQKKILKTIYPGLKSHQQYNLCKKQMIKAGSIITIQFKGGKKNAFKFMNRL